MYQVKSHLKIGYRSLSRGIAVLAVSLVATMVNAAPSGDYFETPGPWEGFASHQGNARAQAQTSI